MHQDNPAHILSHFLYEGQALKQNQYISSINKQFHAIMQSDGNFVVYKSLQFVPENAIWATGTHGRGNGPYTLWMQENGQVVVYDSGDKALWTSPTQENGEYRAVRIELTNNGKLFLANFKGEQVFSLFGGVTPLFNGQLHCQRTLRQDHFISSPNGQFHAIMQSDGNFVVYKSLQFVPENAIWASGTHGRGDGPYRLIMQEDGNLVVYDSGNQPLWASDTWSNDQIRAQTLIITNDGKLELLDNNRKVLKGW